MKELGGYLKRTRISNGVSIEEASSDISLSQTQLENIESGNTRAFKDIYELKEHISVYAKYLGLNADDVIDTFNEFLFEKTSKISLADIKEAEKKEINKIKEEKPKIKSPYTIVYKRKIKIWPIILWIAVILIVFSICLIVIKNIGEEPIRNTVLKSSLEEVYEFTH